MVPLFPTRSWPWVQTPVPPLCYSACLGALGAWVLAHSCVKSQKPAKNYVWKIREIDGSYLCLQQFDKFWMWSAHNDRKRKLCETEINLFLENSWNWRIILVAATIWQVLNLESTEWSETKIVWTWDKFDLENSWNNIKWTFFLADFSYLESLYIGFWLSWLL